MAVKRDKRESGIPARHYSWPPFELGHALSMRHGAYSPRRVDPLATELLEKVAASLDYLAADPSFRPALWAWARAEARVQLLSEYLDEHGSLAEDGAPRAALDALRQFERLAADGRASLGLDPLSRARLGRDMTAAGVGLMQAQQMTERLLQRYRSDAPDGLALAEAEKRPGEPE